MKRVLAGALTVALMGLLAWSGLRRPAADREAAQGRPELAVREPEYEVASYHEEAGNVGCGTRRNNNVG